jgi:hypothetical protein
LSFSIVVGGLFIISGIYLVNRNVHQNKNLREGNVKKVVGN